MIFEYVNPKAGYFVEKIKEVEYQFRGQYLSQCSGKKKKWNFEKNPLENISLPYEEILNACASLIKTGGYKLRETKKREEFVKDLQNLVSGFLELINFEHLMTQKEKEDEDNKFMGKKIIGENHRFFFFTYDFSKKNLRFLVNTYKKKKKGNSSILILNIPVINFIINLRTPESKLRSFPNS